MGEHVHLPADHEGGEEADAEAADRLVADPQLGIVLPGVEAAADAGEVALHLVPVHARAVVPDLEDPPPRLIPAQIDPDDPLLLREPPLHRLPHRQGVDGVLDQLPGEGILVMVDVVPDEQVEQGGDIGLEIVVVQGVPRGVLLDLGQEIVELQADQVEDVLQAAHDQVELLDQEGRRLVSGGVVAPHADIGAAPVRIPFHFDPLGGDVEMELAGLQFDVDLVGDQLAEAARLLGEGQLQVGEEDPHHQEGQLPPGPLVPRPLYQAGAHRRGPVQPPLFEQRGGQSGQRLPQLPPAERLQPAPHRLQGRPLARIVVHDAAAGPEGDGAEDAEGVYAVRFQGGGHRRIAGQHLPHPAGGPPAGPVEVVAAHDRPLVGIPQAAPAVLHQLLQLHDPASPGRRRDLDRPDGLQMVLLVDEFPLPELHRLMGRVQVHHAEGVALEPAGSRRAPGEHVDDAVRPLVVLVVDEGALQVEVFVPVEHRVHAHAPQAPDHGGVVPQHVRIPQLPGHVGEEEEVVVEEGRRSIPGVVPHPAPLPHHLPGGDLAEVLVLLLPALLQERQQGVPVDALGLIRLLLQAPAVPDDLRYGPDPLQAAGVEAHKHQLLLGIGPQEGHVGEVVPVRDPAVECLQEGPVLRPPLLFVRAPHLVVVPGDEEHVLLGQRRTAPVCPELLQQDLEEAHRRRDQAPPLLLPPVEDVPGHQDAADVPDPVPPYVVRDPAGQLLCGEVGPPHVQVRKMQYPVERHGRPLLSGRSFLLLCRIQALSVKYCRTWRKRKAAHVRARPCRRRRYRHSFSTKRARIALRTARIMTPTSAKMASHILADPRATSTRQASLTPIAKTMF